MATLREHERGTVAIEVAYRHKLILIPTSTSIDVRTLEQGLDKEQTELVVQTHRRPKKDKKHKDIQELSMQQERVDY